MRSVVARANDSSPTGVSYFTGDIRFTCAEDGALACTPSTAWWSAEALVFGDVGDAAALAQMFRQIAPTAHDWMVMPVGEALT